jgi:hypothetical protein
VPFLFGERVAPWLFIAALVLMMVLLPFIGKGGREQTAAGSPHFRFMNFQPSGSQIRHRFICCRLHGAKMDVKSDSFAVIYGHRDQHHPVCWPNPT